MLDPQKISKTRLSPRNLQWLEDYRNGKSFAEIARDNGLSQTTVRNTLNDHFGEALAEAKEQRDARREAWFEEERGVRWISYSGSYAAYVNSRRLPGNFKTEADARAARNAVIKARAEA